MGFFKKGKWGRRRKEPTDMWECIEQKGVRPKGNPDFIGQYRQKVRVGNVIFEIPVDVNGFVLPEDLVRRFLDVKGTSRNPARDKAVDATEMIGTCHGLTAEDVKHWWLDPSGSDIRGVDDRKHELVSSSGGSKVSSAELLEHIVFFNADKSKAKKIRSIVDASFTYEEIKTIMSGGSLNVVIRHDLDKKSAGYFDPSTNTINLNSKACEKSVIIHEFTHVLKYYDESRINPVTRSHIREYRRLFDEGKRFEGKCLKDLEESETELESISRMDPYKRPEDPHYYGFLKDTDDYFLPFRFMEEDRKLINGRNQSGSNGIRLQRKIEKRYGKSHISLLKYLSQVPAVDTARKLGWKGMRRHRP